jgi:hypothetical protein
VKGSIYIAFAGKVFTHVLMKWLHQNEEK